MNRGYDLRCVSYEQIHYITEQQINELLERIEPHESIKVLDAMCGYGAVTKWLLTRESKAEVTCLDNSETQLQRARQNLDGFKSVTFIRASLESYKLPENHFDRVVIKNGLHELPKEWQAVAIHSLVKSLKIDGTLVLWTPLIPKDHQSVWCKILQAKDECAGFTALARRRYWYNSDELADYTLAAGFTGCGVPYLWRTEFSTKDRLVPELGNDRNKLDRLNKRLRALIPIEMREQFRYADCGDDVTFTYPMGILSYSKKD